jgi:hypothetical protein
MRRLKRLRQPLPLEFNLLRSRRGVNVRKQNVKRNTVSVLMWGKNVENFASAMGVRTVDNTLEKEREDDNFKYIWNSY